MGRKFFDRSESSQNVWKIFDPKYSKKFRPRIFEKSWARNVRKKYLTQVRKILEPKCSKSFRPIMLGKNSAQEVRKNLDLRCLNNIHTEVFENLSAQVRKIFEKNRPKFGKNWFMKLPIFSQCLDKISLLTVHNSTIGLWGL